MSVQRATTNRKLDPQADVQGALSPSKLPTFIHRSAITLNTHRNGEKWDLAAIYPGSGERQLLVGANVRGFTMEAASAELR